MIVRRRRDVPLRHGRQFLQLRVLRFKVLQLARFRYLHVADAGGIHRENRTNASVLYSVGGDVSAMVQGA